MLGGSWIGTKELKIQKEKLKMDAILRCAQNDILNLDSCLHRDDIIREVKGGVAYL